MKEKACINGAKSNCITTIPVIEYDKHCYRILHGIS